MLLGSRRLPRLDLHAPGDLRVGIADAKASELATGNSERDEAPAAAAATAATAAQQHRRAAGRCATAARRAA